MIDFSVYIQLWFTYSYHIYHCWVNENICVYMNLTARAMLIVLHVELVSFTLVCLNESNLFALYE